MKQTDGLCVCANDRTGLRANIPRSLHAAVHVRALTCLQAFPSFIDTETQSGPYLRGGYGITPPPEMLKYFQYFYICLYSKVVYDDTHKQAQKGEIAATRYVSELQKCPKMRLRPELRP